MSDFDDGMRAKPAPGPLWSTFSFSLINKIDRAGIAEMSDPPKFCGDGHIANCDGSAVRIASQLTLSSPAKLNIFLEVLGRRPDGFHELETVMLRTQFCDQLTFQQTPSSELTLSLSDATPAAMRSGIPLDETNLILRAARALQKTTGTVSGAHIILHKRIPPESGLGGGSSNAATTLLGCRQLWNSVVSDEQLHAIAATLGSDINFLLSGASAAVCRGRGEIIDPIPLARKLYFVALRPRAGNSTAAVFRQTVIPDTPRSSKPLADSILHGTGNLQSRIFNRLIHAASQLNPAMADLLKSISHTVHRPAFMSGSGSTVYVVAASRPDAQSVSEQLKNSCRLPVWILECG